MIGDFEIGVRLVSFVGEEVRVFWFHHFRSQLCAGLLDFMVEDTIIVSVVHRHFDQVDTAGIEIVLHNGVELGGCPDPLSDRFVSLSIFDKIRIRKIESEKE